MQLARRKVKDGKHYGIVIPAGLHRRLKQRAAAEHRFIYDLVVELLERALGPHGEATP